jgi:hypothetical protein
MARFRVSFGWPISLPSTLLPTADNQQLLVPSADAEQCHVYDKPEWMPCMYSGSISNEFVLSCLCCTLHSRMAS